MNKVLVVCGPTATGKTEAAVRLAKSFNGEIINGDSMQVYKQISIASARPTEQEMGGVPHHLFGFLDLRTSFSVADYCEAAHNAINNCHSRNVLPILTGGTGLYIDTVLSGRAFEQTKPDLSLRAELEGLAQREGTQAVYQRLLQLDGEAQVDCNNLRRIIRAIELVEQSKQPLRQILSARERETGYDVLHIGLRAEREHLNQRIESRCSLMLNNGLVDEAAMVDRLLKNTPATAASMIGIREMRQYLRGFVTFAEAERLFKRNTKRYAKRQVTWFKRNEKINWISIQTLALGHGDDMLFELVGRFLT